MRDKPKPVKLFCGLVGRAEAIERARGPLVQAFGEPDCESATLKFDFTAYYRDEMGEGLVRRWLAFEAIRERAYLARAKHIAALIEEQLAVGGKRRVNLDPGYVDDAQVVLSTAKNFSHRIYIGMGYYAEVTLTYEHKAFKLLPWTYPDYQTGEALAFFGQARSIYIAQLRHRADK